LSTVRVGKQNSSHCNVTYDPVGKQQEEEIGRSKRTFEETSSILNLRGRPSRQPIKQGFGFMGGWDGKEWYGKFWEKESNLLD